MVSERAPTQLQRETAATKFIAEKMIESLSSAVEGMKLSGSEGEVLRKTIKDLEKKNKGAQRLEPDEDTLKILQDLASMLASIWMGIMKARRFCGSGRRLDRESARFCGPGRSWEYEDTWLCGPGRT